MEFSRQEHWSGLPFPSPRDLPDPGIEPGSPTLQADALPSEPPEGSTLKAPLGWGPCLILSARESNRGTVKLWMSWRGLYFPKNTPGREWLGQQHQWQESRLRAWSNNQTRGGAVSCERSRRVGGEEGSEIDWQTRISPSWGFPGGPVVQTPCFQCRSWGFDPWLGNEDPTCHVAQPKIRIKLFF